ncbi:uncharacterized protein LOC127258351 [Andrographis paniculata]|uniref:uncharacterized protein LOC127258351 n=1 Tax=Andrographis paniculata TaxID=175694 RepID=UPI0021E70784|nr:uncharacterized protein LOC127258351 [Andrographis paniculata]
MGICSSCESAAVATAKIVMEDGRLQEYSSPVRVSYLLQKNPACFVCNADEMDVGDVIYAVGAEEELQLGQLYFLLPLSLLKRRLQPDEMAALAVKASSALKRTAAYCGETRRNVLVFPEVDSLAQPRKVSGADVGSRRKSGAGVRGNNTQRRLCAIPE